MQTSKRGTVRGEDDGSDLGLEFPAREGTKGQGVGAH
jgi:hypothetical protein